MKLLPSSVFLAFKNLSFFLQYYGESIYYVVSSLGSIRKYGYKYSFFYLDLFVVESVDEVLPVHAEAGLVQLEQTNRRVLVVRRDA